MLFIYEFTKKRSTAVAQIEPKLTTEIEQVLTYGQKQTKAAFESATIKQPSGRINSISIVSGGICNCETCCNGGCCNPTALCYCSSSDKSQFIQGYAKRSPLLNLNGV